MGRVHGRYVFVSALRFALPIFIVALSDCGGSLHYNAVPSVPSPTAQRRTDPAKISAPQSRTAKLEITLTIPAGRHQPATARQRPQSILLMEGPAKLGTFDIASTSKSCKSTSGLTYCSFSANAVAAVNGLFAIKSYSAAGGQGHLLANALVAQTVLAHERNAMPLSFDDTIASIAIVIADADPFPGEALATPVIVDAHDAKGATLVGPGKYSQAITLSDSDTSGATRLSTTKLTDASVPVTLSYDGSARLTGATISATAPGVPKSKIRSATFAPLTAAGINSALQAVENYYLTLPHKSIPSDLKALATHMTASGEFASATIATGCIDATLPNGLHVLLFADHPEDLAGPYEQRPLHQAGSRVEPDAPLSPKNSHEVAFFVNESGDRAFHPQRQRDFAAAFVKSGFTPAAGYGVDGLDSTLENIEAVGKKDSIDFLDIVTHGSVDENGTYWWLSTTLVTDTSLITYAKDLAEGNLLISQPLFYDKGTYYGGFAFNATFLAKHLTFNSGAIIDNESCHGQSGKIVHGPMELASRGVGRYYGWTLAVEEEDADGSDAFLLDRLLGEQSPSRTGLDKYVPQRTPAQRPFPLDRVYDVMETEGRIGPLSKNAHGDPYTLSVLYQPPRGEKGTIYSQFTYSDFGGESVANPPIEYGLPSIEYLTVNEYSTPPQLDIYGTFPAAKGSIAISNSLGVATPSPTSWAENEIEVPIPSAGKGANGNVSVIGAGVASNPVPLTEWRGSLTYAAEGSVAQYLNVSGSGTINESATLDVALRADVHEPVVNVDTTPQPQNVTFIGFNPDSDGVATKENDAFTGSQSSDCAGCTVTYTLANSPPGISQVNLDSEPFGLLNSGPSPACNNGTAGPQDEKYSNVFCAGVSFETGSYSSAAVKCTSHGASWCGSQNGSFSYPSFSSRVNLFLLSVDRTTYALSVTPQAIPIPFSGGPGYDTFGTFTTTITGKFAAPLSPPQPSTPSEQRRPPRPSRLRR